MSETRVAIIGVGNILMGDDGVGVRVIERLQQQPLPEGVELFDAGTAVQDVFAKVADCAQLIVIDAVKAGGAPSEVHCFDLDPDLIGSNGAALSLHDINLVSALRLRMLTGDPIPPVRVLGVEPGRIDTSLELSNEVRASVPEVAALALHEAGQAVRACMQAGGAI